MKPLSLSLLFCTLFLIAQSQTTHPQRTLQQQLENMNSYWKGKQLDAPFLQQQTAMSNEVAFIQLHLSLVESTLREKETAHLSPEQKQNRQYCLDILHDYWQRGIFPINTYHAERTPYFIDSYGTACAVGQLIISTGYESVAQKIHDEDNYAYIRELNLQYPEIKMWADAYGFEMDELAWIQPAYGCMSPVCADDTKRDVSCYGGYDGCAGRPTMTVGTPPYSFYQQQWNGTQWTPSFFSYAFACDIPAGLYRYEVRDAVGDTFYYEFNITQPDSITISISSTDDNGSSHGSAFAQASGGTPPFTYIWSTGDSTQSISNVCFGMYYCSVTDANGCTKADSIIVASVIPTTSVTHGPIIGGVTATAARVFVRTDSVASVEIQFSTDENFSSIAKSLSGLTIASSDSSTIFTLTGLAADTRHHVRTLIDGTESGHRASFKTFPQEGAAGHYKFLFGSCQYDLSDNDSSLFVQMKAENANVFTPTGDWGYPDQATGTNDIYLTNPPTSWAMDYNKVRAIYKERYASSNSAFFLRNIALDYTHDDHDYLNDNTGRDAANIFEINPIGGKFGEPKSVSQPPQARLNLLKGYSEHFPGYALPDSTEGIFHSYIMGNCEFFVLDTRSARTPQHDAIVEVGGEWVIQEPAGHSILGETQMNWLLNGLLTSTADWKFIISSVTFNAGYKAVMDSLLTLGKGSSPILGVDVGGSYISTGLIGAGQMSDVWVGFPSDQNALLDLIETNNLKNIFVISGDAHSAALDDGANSGIPELMSANLKKANSEDPITLSNFIGYPLWNQGASGMGNTNFNSTYGKVEVFGKDSMRMSAVDASGTEVCAYTFKYQQPTAIEPVEAHDNFKIFPNPTSGMLFIDANNPGQKFYFTLISPDGKEIRRELFSGKGELSLSGLPNGNYLYRILNEKNLHLKSGVVSVL